MATTAWLIDVGYVVKVAGKGRFKLDYVAAEEVLSHRFGTTATFLFNGYDEAFGIPDGLHKFYEAMRHHGMAVRLHPMSSGVASGTHYQRRVDVDLAAHLVWQATLPEIEQIVLTAGDQDFLPAVEMARDKLGKRLVLFTYDRDVSNVLKNAVDEHLLLESFRERVERS